MSQNERTASGGEGAGMPGVCQYKEIVLGGNHCHSPDACEYQMFGDDTDPVFCMDNEIREMTAAGEQEEKGV